MELVKHSEFWILELGETPWLPKKRHSLGPLSGWCSSQAPECALRYWMVFKMDRPSLLPSCRGTKPRPNGGSPAAILKRSETSVCWMLSLSTLTWPIPYPGNSTLSRSFLPPSNCNLVASVFDLQPFSSMWKWVCVRERVSGVCAWACGCEGVCLNIIAP